MKKGVTVIEVLVVIVIMSVLGLATFYAFKSMNQKQALDKDSSLVTATLDEARSLTLSSKGDKSYGVHFASSTLTIYEGPTYSSSASTNQVAYLHNFIEVSSLTLSGGGSDIMFERLTGGTDETGTVVIRVKTNTSLTKTITIYSTGAVQSN